MSRIGNLYIPDFGAAVNVVRETIRSFTPDNSPCLEFIRRRNTAATDNDAATSRANNNNNGERIGLSQRKDQTATAAGYEEISNDPRRVASVGGVGYGGIDNEGAITGDGDHEQQQERRSLAAHMFSIASKDSDEFGEGGGEFSTRHKIDEWQAAWNVTNAIQVCVFHFHIMIHIYIYT